jgi:CubicO group peptidase (beta-lactamase class C family)
VDFVAYHDRTGADHQAQFNALYPRGYRMISLSVYQRSNPLYAAVWVRRDGPDWSAVHGFDASQYQAAFNQAAAQGMHPTILSVAGPVSNPVFAGVFEHRPGPVPLTRFGLISGAVDDPNSIQHWDDQAHRNGWRMTAGAVYGDPGEPRYAGIWPANDRRIAWSAAGITDDAMQYQRRFDAQVSGWARPAHVTLDDHGRHLSIFVDDDIGPWIARHGMTSAEYQAEFDRLVPLGFYPINVHGGRTGGTRRFAAIFAKQEQPLARQWTSVGVGTAPAVDAVMKDTLTTAGIRGASLSVVNNLHLVFARGYTWAEPGYPTVLPTTPFRLASVSKVFAGIAIHQLIAEGRLRLSDTVQSVLDLRTPAGALPSAEFNTVTIEDLLLHRSRINNDWRYDVETAQAFGKQLPVSEWEVARYVASLPLLASTPDYNNYGYQLLGLVVARLRGAPSFVDALKASIFDPLHMTRTRGSTSLVRHTPADEARYHRTSETRLDLVTLPSVMTADQPLVADVQGNIHIENGQATGGLSSATVDLARFLAGLNRNYRNPILPRHALVDMLHRAANSGLPRAGHGFDSASFDGTTYHVGKGGYLFTSQNAVELTLDGVGIAVNYNGCNDDVLFQKQWPKILAAIRNTLWSSKKDYFPDFGMPGLA